MFRAAVPSGASTGIYEAVELRDNDKTQCVGPCTVAASEKAARGAGKGPQDGRLNYAERAGTWARAARSLLTTSTRSLVRLSLCVAPSAARSPTPDLPFPSVASCQCSATWELDAAHCLDSGRHCAPVLDCECCRTWLELLVGAMLAQKGGCAVCWRRFAAPAVTEVSFPIPRTRVVSPCSSICAFRHSV